MFPRISLFHRMGSACLATVLTIAIPIPMVSAQDTSSPTDIVARIGENDVITRVEYDRAMSAILQAKQAAIRARGLDPNRPPEGSLISPQEKLQILNNMVDTKILYMEALKANTQVTEEEVNAEVDKRKEGLAPGRTFEDFLEQQDISLDEVKALTRMRLINRKFSDQMAQGLTVADEEVRSEYDAMKSRGLFDTVDIAHVFVAVEGDDAAKWEEARTSIDRARQRLIEGEDFAAVAKEVSTNAPGQQPGGVYTGVMRGRLGPEFDRRMFSMPIGEVSEPFKTNTGWHILKVTAKDVAPFEGEVADRLKEIALRQKRQAAVSKLVQQVRSTLNIQISLPADSPAPTPPSTEGILLEPA